jgi:hypothetical protein
MAGAVSGTLGDKSDPHSFNRTPLMHFEVPKLPHSIKEFATHYVMIVVSILTALGLEAAVERMHHAHAAEAAQRALETELRTNLADLRSSNARNAARLKPLQDLCDLLVKDFDDGVPTAQIKRQMAERVKAGIDFGVFYPNLRHEAWDIAVANQSASFMEPETLRRLSVAYMAQRDVNPASLTVLVNIPAYVNALTDARVGASDPHEFLRSMRQAALTVRGANAKLMELEQDLTAAVPDEEASPAPAARAPSSGASAHH